MNNGKYLAYVDYIHLGGKLDEKTFIKLEFEASKNIDRYTFGRLKNFKNQITEVKMCIFKLIETINIYSSIKDRSISSEDTDGYKISYDTSDKSGDKSNELKSIIKDYLSDCFLEDGTGYLYRG